MAKLTPVPVRDHVRKLLDAGDESTAARMLAAVTPRGPVKPGPVPRAGEAGKPVTFKASADERAMYEEQALEDGFEKPDGSANLSDWIRDCLTARIEASAPARRRR
jgi:hypothetical protein